MAPRIAVPYALRRGFYSLAKMLHIGGNGGPAFQEPPARKVLQYYKKISTFCKFLYACTGIA